MDDGGGAIDTEMDGLTVVLTCQGSVNANATNHMKLAIADASDFILDANVLLKAGSFVAPTPTPSPTATATPTPTPAPIVLPPTGGRPTDGSGSLPWLAVAMGAIALIGGSGAWLAYRTRRIR